ncbi:MULTISPECIES: hydantoinase/oxoprolinase family protein [unclassified Cytobacillus]|uniref:hydantoinase/oxoprolinase family protein n=1 Tax=unclassified Cytobacillus TaxID=2675268 RepID=UPI00203C5812|nr:hydantoinase/oxoprolinase family protein [Cytobacillus sp. AMY 15.2]MCM3092623.1 hydantoinase/oxoprolinase family protein [Cytobacillus sp. AMY 15.2]
MKLGIDVGGTNTDAVIITNGGKLLSWSKQLTTKNIITGIELAAGEALQEANIPPDKIEGVFLGTTHVLNALYYPNNLAKTALIRMTRIPSLIGPAIQWPSNLKKYIGGVYDFKSLCDYKGNKEDLLNPNSGQINKLLSDIEKYNFESICIVGAYSPLYETEEQEIRKIIKEHYPEIPVTMSHEIGSTGFIERENAALLNAILSKVLRQAMTDLSKIFKNLSLNCPYWLTQNDGSLMEIHEALEYPILTIGSGVSNSIRGASILSGLKSCIVVDVGGSTIDIGKIINGQPEVSVGSSSIFDIQVNVRVPQIHSLPYGGGSLITIENELAEIKDTIANDIEQQGMAWGGRTWTLTDSFLKLFPDSFQDETLQLKGLDLLSKEDCRKVIQVVTKDIKETISRLQPSVEDLPVILVGGGSPLLANRLFGRYKKVLHPAGYHICNAVGACFAPLSAELDKVFWLNGITKQEVIEQAKDQLFQQLLQKGAKKESIELVSLEEFPFDYLEGEVLRVRVKALGELA